MPTLEGQTIGEFEVLSSLGQGGMGTVYLAKQSSLNRNVAIKVLPPHLAENATYIERFRREGAAAASFSHPDIVQVFAAGEFNGTHYLAMEYVNGESLHDRLSREGRIPPTESLAIAAHIAQALSYAWQKAQLIHRDVKPSNILISNEGHVKLSDLGMAKCVSENASQLTSTGMALGTPYYISPEQAHARPDIDFRADIYSLGCTLYHMLTGRVPYEASDPVAVILKHVNEPPPNILAVMPDCPPAIVTLLNKMLAKDRDQRQQSYDELVTELFAAHDQITQAPIPAPKPRSRALIYGVAAGAVVAVAAVVLVWSPWKGGAPQQVQEKATASVAQPPPNATAGSPQTEVAKAQTPSSPAAPDKPAGDKGTATQPASSTETATSALPAKPADTQPIMAQQMPPAATANASTDATTAGQSQPMVATTAASAPAPDTSNPVPPTAEPSKDAAAAKPAPASTPESRVTTPESRVTTPESRVTTPESRVTTPESRATDNESPFIKSVAALPPEQQITHVMAKLKELNPQFDGKESHKIESGAVTELAFSTVGVTDIAPLKALKWLKRLSMAPTALNQKGAVSDLSPLAGLPLTGLWCQGNAISDLSPLKGMPLTMLSCGGTQIKDLAPLTGMKLTVLSFNDTEVADLGPLEGMPLTVLWCNNTKVTDLSPLKTTPLRELRCSFVAERDTAALRSIGTLTRINDMASTAFWIKHPMPLVSTTRANLPSSTTAAAPPSGTVSPSEQVRRFVKQMKDLNPQFNGQVDHVPESSNVVEITFTTENVTDITPIKMFTKLRSLKCTGVQDKTFHSVQRGTVHDLSPLAGLKLRELDIGDNNIADLAPLKGMPLVKLDCRRNAQLSDLSPLKGMRLQKLVCDGTSVQDLTPVANMPITSLHLVGTRVSDLSPIRGMPLGMLAVDSTAVTNLAPLKGSKIQVLGIGNTGVKDLTPLKGVPLRMLVCPNVPVTDIQPLKGMPLEILHMTFVPSRDTRVLRSLSTLKTVNSLPVAQFWKQAASTESAK